MDGWTAIYSNKNITPPPPIIIIKYNANNFEGRGKLRSLISVPDFISPDRRSWRS